MKIDAIIFGASGYGGGELLRWLSQHPDVASVRGTSRSRAGQAFHEAHPNLRGLVTGEFEEAIAWSSLKKSAQPVVFSALPHGELARTMPDLEAAWSEVGLGERLLLIDLSADFRIGPFVYGLPEWNRAAIEGARRIASPGCFATALQLALQPLRGLNVGFIAATAVTGSSGSGATPSATTHHATRANDFRAYKMLTHQHKAEVSLAMSACAIEANFSFVPQSGPFVRGIFATLQFAAMKNIRLSHLQARAQKVFAEAPFVRLVEGSPQVAAVVGTNFADIGIAADAHSSAIMVAIDNLGKGMAGQAVQSMNIALGLPETAGLWTAGRFPV
ncbi:MAG: N-acetyl-gamma-glutamyl-phosphate reductase [Verrucomicrobiota bacterium]|nr:N-acetyl-gamma-glutamyl-phosphate reductase [Verrucomicrobiota bacterium]